MRNVYVVEYNEENNLLGVYYGFWRMIMGRGGNLNGHERYSQ